MLFEGKLKIKKKKRSENSLTGRYISKPKPILNNNNNKKLYIFSSVLNKTLIKQEIAQTFKEDLKKKKKLKI